MSRPQWLDRVASAPRDFAFTHLERDEYDALVAAADIVLALAEWYELVYTEHFGIAEQAVAWRQQHAQ